MRLRCTDPHKAALLEGIAQQVGLPSFAELARQAHANWVARRAHEPLPHPGIEDFWVKAAEHPDQPLTGTFETTLTRGPGLTRQRLGSRTRALTNGVVTPSVRS